MARAFDNMSEPTSKVITTQDSKHETDVYPQHFTCWYLMPIKIGKVTRTRRLRWEHESGIRTRTMADMQNVLYKKALQGELSNYLPQQKAEMPTTAARPRVWKFTAADLINKGVWGAFMAIRPKAAAQIQATTDRFELTEAELRALKLPIPGGDDEKDSSVQAG